MKRILILVFVSALLSVFPCVKAQPVITAQPQSRTNNVGDNAQFTVAATGDGLTYQWQFNNGDIPDATNATLNQLVTDTAKAGTYRVVVKDSAAQTAASDAVTLFIPYGNRAIVAQWNFNSVSPDNSVTTGTTAPSIGSGTLSAAGASANGFNTGSTSDPAASDNSSRRWNALSLSAPNKSAGAQFSVATVGYKDIVISGELWLPARASAYWRGQYTVNGTDWIDHTLISRHDANLSGFIYFSDDLSGVPDVKGNPSFAYRVVAEWESTATGSGSDAYVAVDPAQTVPSTGSLFGWDMVTVLGAVDSGGNTPVITGQPASRNNNVGDNAQFSVTASGLGTLTYQWKFAGNPIAGATESTLNVIITNVSQAGAYTVVVTDSANANSVESDNAFLSIPAGTRKMITQWNFNSVPPDADERTGTTDPSFGSGAMSLVNVTGNNYNTGSVSDPASLGPDNSARALQGPNQVIANKTGGPQFAVDTTWYKDIIVSCELWVASRASAYWRGQYTTNGTDWVDRILIDKRTQYLQTGSATYAFYYDDLTGVEGVENNPNFAYRFVSEWESTATGTGSDAYVMANPNDPGGFNNTGPFRLDMVSVQGAYLSDTPIILSQPHSATVPAGATVAFSVSALGDDLSYEWHSDSGAISAATNATLLLPNVQASQMGNYWVVISTPNGSTNSQNATLTVIDHQLPPGDRYWLGGAGVWNTTLANWGLSADGPFDRVWDNANLDSALFVANGAQPGAITLAEAITINKLTITNAAVAPAYSFNGDNTLTFAGANPEVFVEGTTSNSGTNSAIISCRVDATVLTKTGGGRMVFNNSSNTVQRWVVNGGAIASADDVAAIFGVNQPAALVPNFITLDNGGLGFATASTTAQIGTNRGIYLGPGGGQIGNTSSSGIITLDSPITGPGRLWFPSTGYWPGQAQGANGTYIISNPNNSYAGETLIEQCEIRCGTDYVFPVSTTLSISNNTVNGRLNLNGTQQAVNKVLLDSRTGNSRIFDSVGGGTLTANEFELRGTGYTGDSVSAVLAGGGVLRKTSTGSISISSANTYTGATFHEGGTIQLNGSGRFGNGDGTVYLEGNDGTVTIALNQTRTTDTILQNPVVMTAPEVQLQNIASSTGEILYLSGGPWNVQSGTLYLVNVSINEGCTFILALTNSASFAESSSVWLWNDSVGISSLNPAGTEQIFNGVISGSGTFRRSVLSGAGGRTIFTADNSYSGGTLVEAGTLLVNNAFGSGTGFGSVTVNGGVLGGTGSIAGNVVVNSGGSIAAGASVGTLTLQNGLDLSGGGTNVWELSALKDNTTGTAGTDFDQLVLNGGELQLGGSSTLTLQFLGGSTPDSTMPFWQVSHTWNIIRLNGGQNTASQSFAAIANGAYNAGNFSTSVDGGGNILLTFTPGVPSEPHITAQPQSRTNIVGTTATFFVAATGSDPLTYEWFRTDAPFTPIAGATSATLTIGNVQPASAGQYFARVYNTLGNATSQSATLTVVSQPSLQNPVWNGSGEVTLTWPAIPGMLYQVQYNTNLATANWYTFTNILATGTSLSVADHPPLHDSQRFYRLLIP